MLFGGLCSAVCSLNLHIHLLIKGLKVNCDWVPFCVILYNFNAERNKSL